MNIPHPSDEQVSLLQMEEAGACSYIVNALRK